MRDTHVVQQSRREVRHSLNQPSGVPVVMQRAHGVRDDTADSCADSVTDSGDGFGLGPAGATRGDVVVERARAIDWDRVPWCFYDREDGCIGIVVVGRNPIGDHLMGIGRG